jgi:type IV pilus assembly protein PilA
MPGTRRKGFTLIELLIVVVIIGILASIAIPKFGNTKEKAMVASMKSDLHNLAIAQESFFADSNRYGTEAQLAVAPYGVKLSRHNEFIAVVATPTGWSAAVRNPGVKTATSDECGVFAGDATPVNGATIEGAPHCD